MEKEKSQNEILKGNEHKAENKFFVSAEMSADSSREVSRNISDLVVKIDRDKPIIDADIQALDKIALKSKIEINGEIMTVEEAENNSELIKNVRIWREIKNGNFANTGGMTMIIPKISNCLGQGSMHFNLKSLKSTKGLIFPKVVSSNLYLSSLVNADGLVMPARVEGHVFLNKLKSAIGAVFPEWIMGDLILNDLSETNGLVLSREVVGSVYLNGSKTAEGLVLPTFIGGGLHAHRLTTAKGIVFPAVIEGILSLESLVTADGFEMPQRIDGGIYFGSMPKNEIEKLINLYPRFQESLYSARKRQEREE